MRWQSCKRMMELTQPLSEALGEGGLAQKRSLGGPPGVQHSVIGHCAPPHNFRAVGELRRSWPCSSGPFSSGSPKRMSAAQKAGLRYEAKVLKKLKAIFKEEFLASQWFRFQDRFGLRYCQTDGILLRPDACTIIEVKTTFTSDAWWQLRKLYAPVVQRAYFPEKIVLVVVCKHFDPATRFPESTEHLPIPRSDGWPDRPKSEDPIRVLCWKL